jgi:hypothetical protein
MGGDSEVSDGGRLWSRSPFGDGGEGTAGAGSRRGGLEEERRRDSVAGTAFFDEVRSVGSKARLCFFEADVVANCAA